MHTEKNRHPVIHFEIGCHHGEETRAFLQQLFGWEIAAEGPGMTIETGSTEGIGGHIAELASEWGTYITVYVEVEDLEAYLEKAGELGGKKLVGPVTLPDGNSFAWLAAPEGHIIGIWKPA